MTGIAANRRGAAIEQKLDMALDDLASSEVTVDSNRHHLGRRERDGPYSRPTGKGYDSKSHSKGKGKGRRIPMEEKALLHTQFFFNQDGDFILKLYDTEVLVMKKRPEPVDGESKLDLPLEGGGDGAAELGAVTLCLSSGTFKTAETKFILNEALNLFSVQISEMTDSPGKWIITGQGLSQDFEDDLKLHLKGQTVRASCLKQHFADKLKHAKALDAARRTQTPRAADVAMGSHPPQGHWGSMPQAFLHAPPGWGVPPSGWGPPPQYQHGPLMWDGVQYRPPHYPGDGAQRGGKRGKGKGFGIGDTGPKEAPITVFQ